MRIKVFLLVTAYIVFGASCFTKASDHKSKEKKYPSSYKTGIVVNGISSEWDASRFNFNKQAQVNYSIVNDSSAFYLCIRIADEYEQMKALRNGIELRFNTRGKKKTEETVLFPIGGKMEMGGRMSDDEKRNRRTMQLMLLLKMQDMEVTGFRNGVNGMQNIKSGKNGFLAAFNWDSTNVMVYEARIPFNAFITDVKEANPLTVGIIIKGATKPKPEDNDAGMQNQGQGGMPGHQGGMNQGATGGGGQMQSYANMKIYEDDEIWQSIVVAKKEY
ncbi:MAG: hypothetical protein ABSD71_09410 [Bacteroidales bacterium]|jgi:hypothetical protein